MNVKSIYLSVKYGIDHQRGARRGRIQVPFSRSTIDFGRMVKVARRNKFRGWFEIEYCYIDWEHCNEYDTISETIQYRDFLCNISA